MSDPTASKPDYTRALDDDELARWPTVYRDDLFKQQVILITGATGGIGRACSILFGRLGATVVGCGRDVTKLEALSATLDGYGIANSMHGMTVRDPTQVESLLDAVWQRHGRLDMIINNAGGQFAAPALDISPKGWHAVVETILYGSWYMMQGAARRWQSRGQPGVIVNMSTLFDRPFPGIPHTAAARAGQVNLSTTLSVEWAPYDIRINTIAIGLVASPGLVNYPLEARASFDRCPMRRPGDVMDVAEAAVYLCAPSSKYVTGSVLTVDGGAHAWGEYWSLGKPDYFKAED